MLTWIQSLLSIFSAVATISIVETTLFRSPSAQGAPSSGSKTSTDAALPKSNLQSVDGKDSLRIRQHSRPSGEEEIWVSPYGIKITNLRNQYVSLFPAPYKEVHSYNLKTKKLYSCPIKQYKSPYASSMALLKAITFADVVTSKYKEAPYKGCTADFSKIPNNVMLQRFKERAKGDLVSRSPVLLEMVSTSKVLVAPAPARFLCIYYGLPQKQGLVLEMKYETFSSLKHQYLTTDKIEPKVFKPSDFAPPANYIKAKNDGDLLLDNDSEGSMNLMIMDH